MARLLTKYTKTLDAKGRLAVPVKHRNAFPDGQKDTIFLTRGFEKCIKAYYTEEWDKFEEWIVSRDVSAMEKNILIREFLGRAAEVSFDAQGRIVVPPDLLEWAHLVDEKEVYVVGMHNSLEIWNKSDHQETQGAVEDIVNRVLSEKQ